MTTHELARRLFPLALLALACEQTGAQKPPDRTPCVFPEPVTAVACRGSGNACLVCAGKTCYPVELPWNGGCAR